MTTIIIIALLILLILALSVSNYRKKTISFLCETLKFQIRVNQFKVYPTLKEIRENNLLDNLEDDDWIAHYSDEHKKALGDKYLIWSTVKQFKIMRDIAHNLQQELEQEILWGTSKHSESI